MANETAKWKTISRAGAPGSILVLMVLVLGGCGKKEYGEVYGTVTFEGKPVTEGMVVCADEEWGTFLTARIQPDGRYVFPVTAQGGLPMKGVYRVTVTPPPVDAPAGIVKTPPKPREYPNIPPKYRDPKNSGLKFELEQSRFQFDIKMSP